MTLKRYLPAVVLALFISPVSVTSAKDEPAGSSVSMDVMGSITATLNGKEAEWLTISGNLKGEGEVASANWNRFTVGAVEKSESMDNIMQQAQSQMSAEERHQFEQMRAMLAEADADNPLAAMLGPMFGAGNMHQAGPITVSISGHNPDSPNILTEQVLSLAVTLNGQTNLASLPGKTIPADIHYIAEGSGEMLPAVIYVSDENEHAAKVTFEKIKLDSEDAYAAGRFEAKLCRFDLAKLMEGPDLSDCMQVAGAFDTALVEN